MDCRCGLAFAGFKTKMTDPNFSDLGFRVQGEGFRVGSVLTSCSGSEAGSYLRLIDLCITQL